MHLQKWCLLWAFPLLAGSFTHPDGVFSLNVPEGWEIRVVQGEDGPVYVLQHAQDYAATVIMGYTPGSFSPDNMEALNAEVRDAFPTLSPVRSFQVYARKGRFFRAKGDFEEHAGGKETLARIYVAARPMMAAYLICVAAKSDFGKFKKAFAGIASTLRLARPDPAARAALAGTWEAGSAYNDPFSNYSSFSSWAYTFTADGRYGYASSVSAGGEGVSAYGGDEERGFFFVMGRSVFLVAQDGSWTLLKWVEKDLLVDPEGTRYVRTN